ncbi:uncharacterized protein YKR070W isoform X4 [Carya illinoinensis]|uniref:Uncharacterized protein n=1 Tax=Carya illinoinensis TaxID=32201 RepID=A0A8T1NRV0_CARIL|nr:uncharacterized protein YKR070W isoform X4 [Carya illinoinensis]KAG6631633.1 hypothetical protein CIPAW_13G104100 [Carya illinoinensis]
MGSFGILRRASQSQRSNTKQLPSLFFSLLFSRSISQLSSQSQWPSFGIAFDIDGVVLREDTPIGGSPQALRRLYDDSGYLKIPYVFLTNGGGFRESKRAFQLSELLGVNILSSQVLQGHSPFKQLVDRYENEFIVAVGKGEPAAVMFEYGFKNVLSIDEYASFFEDIDPLAKYKKWTSKLAANQSSTFNKITQTKSLYSQRVQAAFVVSDSVDWSRDIQVLCDILRTGGLPGREIGNQPPLYFAHDDLKYQLHVDHAIDESHFKTVYMVGDNPTVDIKGARQAGHPWFSILTRTGVFKGKENDADFPADLVVDTVEEVVDYILRKERISRQTRIQVAQEAAWKWCAVAESHLDMVQVTS